MIQAGLQVSKLECVKPQREKRKSSSRLRSKIDESVQMDNQINKS
jgi:hypothetical protein